MADRYQVRLATPGDVWAIVELERRVFPNPWTPASIADALGPMTWVSTDGAIVVGYVFARSAADEGEILNLAVDPIHRRRGVAASLLSHALDALADAGARTAYLEVRESNQAARAFYRREGFEDFGWRRSYYRRPVEDAVVMRKRMQIAECRLQNDHS